jgi:Spy/CpxP family protein refolding chaperone
VAFAILGTYVAWAGVPGRYCWHRRDPFSHISRELQLTHDQRVQIKSMWISEKPQIARLVRDFAAENKEMQAANSQRGSNQEAILAIADREGTTLARLIIEKQNLQSKVESVLTPAQRTKADEVEKHWQQGIDTFADRLSSPSDSTQR